MISQEVYNQCRDKLLASDGYISSSLIQFSDQNGTSTVQFMLADYQCDVGSEEELINIVDNVVALNTSKWG
jgi:hypothetical protein